MALLFAPLPPLTHADFASSDGFCEVPLREVLLEVAVPPRYGAPMTMIRGGDLRDLPAIVAMGRARAAASAFHLERDVDFVQYAITRRRLLAGLCRQVPALEHFCQKTGAHQPLAVRAGELRAAHDSITLALQGLKHGQGIGEFFVRGRH